MESLLQVGVGLPNPQDVEIPSGESQSAEAAQVRPELPTRAGVIGHGSAQESLLTRPQQAEMTPVLKERVDFNKDDEVEPSMWKSALMTATRNWLSAPVGSGLTPGPPSDPEELETMSSSSLGFSMLAKGMAKRVGDVHISVSLDEYMKRAVATTTPIVNSYVSWKSGSQKRVQKYFSQQPRAEKVAPPSFTVGQALPASSSSAGIFDAAGNELVWDDDLDDFKLVLDTAFDAAVWDTIGNDKKATASELHEAITGTHHYSADLVVTSNDYRGIASVEASWPKQMYNWRSCAGVEHLWKPVGRSSCTCL